MRAARTACKARSSGNRSRATCRGISVGVVRAGRLAVIRSDRKRRWLGGYNADVIAGEDSELVRAWTCSPRYMSSTKLDYPMATHDADMTSFQQWWRRSVRAGHAIGQRAHLNGNSALKDGMRERNSTLFWGLGSPCAILATAPFTHGLSLIALGAYGVLAWRVGAPQAGRYARGRLTLYALPHRGQNSRTRWACCGFLRTGSRAIMKSSNTSEAMTEAACQWKVGLLGAGLYLRRACEGVARHHQRECGRGMRPRAR